MALDQDLNQARYEATELGGGRVRFVVTAAPVPKLGCLFLFVGGLCALLGGLVLSWGGLLSIVGLVGGGIGGYKFAKWFWKRDVDKRRAPGGEFIAGPEGIEVGGERIAKDRIHQFVIRNGMDVARQASVVRDNASAQRHANLALAAQVSYMLQVESGGRATTLAGGMTETCATGLQADVMKAMGG
ncbi:MAG: hypothetical protein KF902_00320 [Phycisphaeraceae bacterium]|nr:hypothetical protein [Phycisphaeraceae bacterium]MCW5769633.1 hypothetical protein [Phycisphaeraceae bacterium]